MQTRETLLKKLGSKIPMRGSNTYMEFFAKAYSHDEIETLLNAPTKAQVKCPYCHTDVEDEYEDFEEYVLGFESEKAGAIFNNSSSVLLPKKKLLVTLYFPAFDMPDYTLTKIECCPICGGKLEEVNK